MSLLFSDTSKAIQRLLGMKICKINFLLNVTSLVTVSAKKTFFKCSLFGELPMFYCTECIRTLNSFDWFTHREAKVGWKFSGEVGVPTEIPRGGGPLAMKCELRIRARLRIADHAEWAVGQQQQLQRVQRRCGSKRAPRASSKLLTPATLA